MEQTYLMPFYQRFLAAMDAAGWSDKPLYAEPLVFWNTGFFESGGLSTVGRLGSRYPLLQEGSPLGTEF